MFWAYLGVWVVSMIVAVLVVDPTLIQERTRPGPGGKDYATAILLTPLWLGQCVVAALDVGATTGATPCPWSSRSLRCWRWPPDWP